MTFLQQVIMTIKGRFPKSAIYLSNIESYPINPVPHPLLLKTFNKFLIIFKCFLFSMFVWLEKGKVESRELWQET